MIIERDVSSGRQTRESMLIWGIISKFLKIKFLFSTAIQKNKAKLSSLV